MRSILVPNKHIFVERTLKSNYQRYVFRTSSFFIRQNQYDTGVEMEILCEIGKSKCMQNFIIRVFLKLFLIFWLSNIAKMEMIVLSVKIGRIWHVFYRFDEIMHTLQTTNLNARSNQKHWQKESLFEKAVHNATVSNKLLHRIHDKYSYYWDKYRYMTGQILIRIYVTWQKWTSTRNAIETTRITEIFRLRPPWSFSDFTRAFRLSSFALLWRTTILLKWPRNAKNTAKLIFTAVDFEKEQRENIHSFCPFDFEFFARVILICFVWNTMEKNNFASATTKSEIAAKSRAAEVQESSDGRTAEAHGESKNFPSRQT